MNWLGMLNADLLCQVCEVACNSCMLMNVCRQYSCDPLKSIIQTGCGKALNTSVPEDFRAAVETLRNVQSVFSNSSGFWRSYALFVMHKTSVLARKLWPINANVKLSCTRSEMQLPYAYVASDMVAGSGVRPDMQMQQLVTRHLNSLHCRVLERVGDRLVGLLFGFDEDQWNLLERVVVMNPTGDFDVRDMTGCGVRYAVEERTSHFSAGRRFVYLLSIYNSTIVLQRYDVNVSVWSEMEPVDAHAIIRAYMVANPEWPRRNDFTFDNQSVSHVALVGASVDGTVLDLLVTFTYYSTAVQCMMGTQMRFSVDFEARSVTMQPLKVVFSNWISKNTVQSVLSVSGKYVWMLTPEWMQQTQVRCNRYRAYVLDLESGAVAQSGMLLFNTATNVGQWQPMRLMPTHCDWLVLAVFANLGKVVPLVYVRRYNMRNLSVINVSNLNVGWVYRGDPVAAASMRNTAPRAYCNAFAPAPGGFMRLAVKRNYELRLIHYKFLDAPHSVDMMRNIAAVAEPNVIARLSVPRLPAALHLLTPLSAEVVQRPASRRRKGGRGGESLRFHFACSRPVSAPLV